MNIPSACRIATIALNNAMILPYDANLGRMEFSERAGQTASAKTQRCPPLPERGHSLAVLSERWMAKAAFALF
jgi:hypothetical protein